jgi:hypothetical protein
MLLIGFWGIVHGEGDGKGKWSAVNLNAEMLIEGDFAAASVLITFGAVIGKTSPLQPVTAQ